MKAFKARTRLAVAISAAGLMATLGGGHATAGGGKSLASVDAEQGYSLGHTIGRQAAAPLGDVDGSALVRGFSDAIRARARNRRR